MKECNACEKVNDECIKSQIQECLAGSRCEYCDNPHWYYPYGKDESRHCTSCGAEWSVYK